MEKRLRLILGDQLNEHHSWFSQDQEHTIYLMCELQSEATYARHHIQKLVGFFGSMRAFAKQLEQKGYHLIYYKINDVDNQQSFEKNINAVIKKYRIDKFEYQLPDEYRLDDYFNQFCLSLDISYQAYDTEHFYTSRTELEEYFKGKKNHTMEFFYRAMRKKYGLLLELDGSPLGGKWNYDALNRNRWTEKSPKPKELSFSNDVTHVLNDIRAAGIPSVGTLKANVFTYPINRSQALRQLDFFCKHLLVHFGDYQDAMHSKEAYLFHSKLSFALNVKLISPKEVVQQTLFYYQKNKGAIHISQLEGFIRQIIGWREYMRGMYWKFMPSFKSENYFQHKGNLADFYWTADTKMNCLKCSVKDSLERSYAHHIQRLMILGNFALLTGVDPDQLDDWFLGIYADAVQWVQLPNTRGMSQFADGGLIATKPYISAASYINRMSNYCKGCQYDHKEKTSENACPFNSLYWNFLMEKRPQLESNNRMKMMYAMLDKKTNEQRRALQEKALSIISNPDAY